MLRIQLIICSAILLMSTAAAIDNHHFYRASNFFPTFHEPRLEKPGLTSLDLTFGGGATDKSLKGCGRPFLKCNDESNVLNICGYYNMQALGKNLPFIDLSNEVDSALNNLAQLPARDNFAMLSFKGKFSIAEANFIFTQNGTRGFFFQMHAPVRKLSLKNMSHCDLSPDDLEFPNKNTAQWQEFLPLFNTMLTQYDLSLCSIRKTGVGDTSLLAGWTTNYENTTHLDFIDVTLRAGVLLPTAREANANLVFDLPLGYNGHLGFPFTFTMSLGLFEWFTWGIHAGVMPFADKIQNVRVRTDATQEGLIALTKVCTNVHEGTLWDVTSYVKADHICRGLSFLIGFTYAQKNGNRIDSTVVDNQNVNLSCDLTTSGWIMKTVHLFAEYDFYKHGPPFFTPRAGIFVNVPVGGKHIFDTTMGGASGGFEMTWRF